MNEKGVKYIETYVAPLLTSSLFQLSFVCTDMHMHRDNVMRNIQSN